MKISIHVIALLVILFFASMGKQGNLPKTSVMFSTTDTVLQKLFDNAELKANENIIDYGNRKVLIEGAQYRSVWLETQPMGGYMYAKRNIEVAKNNIEIFIDYQRPDGRLPGVIYNRNGKIEPNYVQFQGLYLPMPAYELYFLLGKDKVFLMKVYTALEKFDAYLWKTRDSDNDGCLETWCMYDNGEDYNVRFNGFPRGWAFDYPPSKEAVLKLTNDELKKYCKENNGYDSTREMTVPIESMDVMSYSYTCRDVLSLISKELNIGKEDYWRNEAKKVKDKIKSYLWYEGKNACFDKDKNNITMPILLHNNLRCMYFGSLDQDMADRFVKYHLLNPKEFWTPMPLPSIAANDPAFRNIQGNNWSGQPQGLTFQRSIQALENYGHYAELTMIGETFLNVLCDSHKFTQQFDPFTQVINNSKDGYGPSILAALEFISRFYGIHITRDKIYWSCLDRDFDHEYIQGWNGRKYVLQTKNDTVKCFINNKQSFYFTKGARVVTDLNGELIEITGIDTVSKPISFNNKVTLTIEPNAVYKVNDKGEISLYKSIEFAYPYKSENL